MSIKYYKTWRYVTPPQVNMTSDPSAGISLYKSSWKPNCFVSVAWRTYIGAIVILWTVLWLFFCFVDRRRLPFLPVTESYTGCLQNMVFNSNVVVFEKLSAVFGPVNLRECPANLRAPSPQWSHFHCCRSIWVSGRPEIMSNHSIISQCFPSASCSPLSKSFVFTVRYKKSAETKRFSSKKLSDEICLNTKLYMYLLTGWIHLLTTWSIILPIYLLAGLICTLFIHTIFKSFMISEMEALYCNFDHCNVYHLIYIKLDYIIIVGVKTY